MTVHLKVKNTYFATPYRIRDKYSIWMGNQERLPVEERDKLDRRSLAAWIVEVWNDMQASIDLKKTLAHIGYIAQ